MSNTGIAIATDLQDRLLESHEERIQRLADGVQECNSLIVETRTDLKYMFAGINETLRVHGAKLDGALGGLETFKDDWKPRLEVLEKDRTVKVNRRVWLRNTIIGLVLTGAGAAIAEVASKLVGK
jgi:hypothetical protein